MTLAYKLVYPAVAAAALALAAPARADMITIDLIDTAWDNPMGGDAVVITNQGGTLPDTVSWGIPFPGGAGTGPKSAYTFDPREVSFVVNTALPPNTANVFLLGTFNHINNVIFVPEALRSVDLLFTVGTFDMATTLGSTFTFEHNETPNEAPCQFPSPANNPCNDRVTITNASFNAPIQENGKDYFFTLLGFSTDGGITTRTFFDTIEGQQNPAGLYAVITDRPFFVPEPMSLSLLGLGLFGLGIAARRRRAA